MTKEKCILVGSSNFARELICWIEHANETTKDPIDLVGFITDEEPDGLSAYGYSLPYLGTITDYKIKESDKFLIAIADSNGRKKVVSILEAQGAKFASFIHTGTLVVKSATLGKGVIICPGCGVSANAKIGDFVIVLGSTGIGHDVTVGNFCTISAAVNISGHAIIGESVFIGTGAIVLPHLKVGAYSKIGPGSIIMRSVPENATMYAPPAKRL